jgi:hypothetical protein
LTPTTSTREGRSYADPARTCEPPGAIRSGSPRSAPGWLVSPLGGNFWAVSANLFPPSGEPARFPGDGVPTDRRCPTLPRSPRSVGHFQARSCPTPPVPQYTLAPPIPAPDRHRHRHRRQPTTPRRGPGHLVGGADTSSGARTRYCVTPAPSWCPKPRLLGPTRGRPGLCRPPRGRVPSPGDGCIRGGTGASPGDGFRPPRMGFRVPRSGVAPFLVGFTTGRMDAPLAEQWGIPARRR